jgi:CDP-diacylglycerol--serine O-phosphatidyltransferase
MSQRWFPVLGYANAANAVTTLGAASGLFAIVAAAQGAPRAALVLLCGAILCDKVDGSLARRLGQASAFGRDLDSLADALSFCIAPALIGAFRGLPLWGVAAAGFYAVAGLWRLALFNIIGLTGQGREERFTGVPTTIAASWFLLLRVAVDQARLAPAAESALFAAAYVVLGLLMTSALAFPKRGLAVKSLYLLLPAAALITLLR